MPQLAVIQGELLSEHVDDDLARFVAHMVGRGLPQKYIRDLRSHAAQFLDYIKHLGIGLGAVEPDQVKAYFRVALRTYRKRRPNRLKSLRHWRMISRRSVHGLLRFAQGEWPPGSRSLMLERFRGHSELLRYNRDGMSSRISAARQFLVYLRQQGTSLEEARPSHVDAFVQTKLEVFRKRHDCLPRNSVKWRSSYTGPIHGLLRMVRPEWPLPEPPANECERFQREVCDGYGRWLTEVQGLSQETLRKNGDAARLFVRWLGERADCESLGKLSVLDIDSYLECRMQRLRRATRWGVADCLRSFLRYLNLAGFIPRDLSVVVAGPTLYKFEEIPRAFTEQQVEKLLEVTRRDLSPTGRRDYAMLLLLATYGLRAGEVVRLCVDDIDWREERLRVRHSKTGVESWLPLVAPVGEALLNYLEHGRPKTVVREVFLRVHAPHGPFGRGGAVDTVINRRLEEAGIDVKGRRHGSHAFRFARAANLLHASVSLKSIGDLLGHRTVSSTAIYLRLPSDGLRAISLEVPRKACQC